ncbi:MAG: GNAT family N-acetyltransferase, partial [Methyloceanibacter sp.]
AAALMDAVMAYATRQNIWQLELFVNQDNARAIAFYTRYGFTEAGRIPNSILGLNRNTLRKKIRDLGIKVIRTPSA